MAFPSCFCLRTESGERLFSPYCPIHSPSTDEEPEELTFDVEAGTRYRVEYQGVVEPPVWRAIEP